MHGAAGSRLGCFLRRSVANAARPSEGPIGRNSGIHVAPGVGETRCPGTGPTTVLGLTNVSPFTVSKCRGAARRVSGGSRVGNELSLFHPVTDVNNQGRIVVVPGLEAAGTVVDGNPEPGPGDPLRANDPTIGRGPDRGAAEDGVVLAAVQFAGGASDRAGPDPKAAGDVPDFGRMQHPPWPAATAALPAVAVTMNVGCGGVAFGVNAAARSTGTAPVNLSSAWSAKPVTAAKNPAARIIVPLRRMHGPPTRRAIAGLSTDAGAWIATGSQTTRTGM